MCNDFLKMPILPAAKMFQPEEGIILLFCLISLYPNEHFLVLLVFLGISFLTLTFSSFSLFLTYFSLILL